MRSKLLGYFRVVNLGAFLALALKVGSVGLAYLQNIVLAHCMNPSAFGEYAIGLSVAMFMGIAVAAGQPTAILRFWPQYLTQKSEALARGALTFGYVVTSISSFAFGAFAFALAFFLTAWGMNVSALAQAVPLTVAWAFSEFLMAALRAKGSVAGAMLPRDVLWRVAIIAIGVAHWESGLEISSRAVLMWCALVLSLLVAAQATYSGRLTPSYFRELTPRFDLPLWSRAALGLGLATTIGMINTQIDTPLVGLYLTKAETGQFFAVQKTASLLIIVLWATIIVAAPNFSRLYHSRQVHELQRISRSFAISVGSLSLAIYFVFFVFGRFLLGLFGPSFTDLTLELRIMSTGYLIDALCGPAGVLLLLSGHERLHLKILLVFLALKTSLMILLLPRFGLLGAAIGASLSQAIVPVVLCLYIRRTIGIDPSVMGALNYLRRA